MFFQILMELVSAAYVNETVMLLISTVAVTCILSAFVMVCFPPTLSLLLVWILDAMRFECADIY